jgi:3-keto-disaccharide hydrolase
MTFRKITPYLSALALAAALACAQEAKHHAAIGYSDTPVLPGQKWRVHDIDRPRPPMVTPGANPGDPPSDAVVLFDGKNLSHWTCSLKGQDVAPAWKVENGYIEVIPGTGDLVSKEKFGDCQIHVEWATPSVVQGESQDRGNSGILIMNRYEVQVLDSYGNVTYADGQAGALYGQWPPLVNASRPPGKWQTYDIAWVAPKFEGGKLVKPAYATVFHNGVLLHDHQEVLGTMVHRAVAVYTPHGSEEPLGLQNHGTYVRYRNIWVRRVKGYDQP